MPSHGYHWENALAGVMISTFTVDNLLGKVPTSGIYVGTGGTLIVADMDGTSATFRNVASGQILPIKVTKVLTGTTATDLVFLY